MTDRVIKGKRIVITASARTGKNWADYLKKGGAIVHQFPTIEIVATKPTKKIIKVLSNLDTFDWMIFTSATGPHTIKDLMEKLGIKKSTKKIPLIAVIGKKTAQAVASLGWRVTFIPSISNSATLADELKPFYPNILLLRADIASTQLPNALKKRGAKVTDIATYTTKIITKNSASFSKLLQEKKIDYIIFASPSAVRGFCVNIQGDNLRIARTIPAIAISPRVSRTLKDVGFTNIRTAKSTGIASIKNSIINL